MARNQDHLTTDSDTPRPGATPPPQPVADGPPVEALDDAPAGAPAEPGAPPPPKREGNQDKPTLRAPAPLPNVRRAEIMKYKRSEAEQGQEKLEDIIGKENVKAATYGKDIAERMSAEETLGEADTAGETATKAEPQQKGAQTAKTATTEPPVAKLHGNSMVDVKVNRKLIPVAMRDLRAVLVEHGVDPTDLPDRVVVESAQTMLAARERLNEAKAGRSVDEEGGDQPREQRKPFNLLAAMKEAMEEQMYGDPDKAAAMMADAVTTISAGASAHLMEQRDTSVQRNTSQTTMRDAQLEWENKPEFQGFVKQRGRAAVNTALAMEGVGYLTEELSKHIDPNDYDLSNPDVRGNLYVDLRRQGVSLPSEADIIRQAHKRALTLYGALRGGASTNQPAVNLSAERTARREGVSTQPRAANAAANPIAQPKSRSDVVLEMQRARPR